MKHLLLLLMLPFTFSGGAEQVDLGKYKDLKTPKIGPNNLKNPKNR